MFNPEKLTPKEIGVAAGKKERAHRETEHPFEEEGPEKLSGVSRVVVRGSVAYALMAKKDLKLARDLDVFFVKQGFREKMTVENFENFDQLKKIFPKTPKNIIEKFIKANTLEDVPIQVVNISEGLLSKVSLFDNEPEVVLWDPALEIRSRLLRRVSEKTKEELLRKMAELGLYENKRLVSQAHEAGLYRQGKLYRGEIPTYLEPHDQRLAVSLRLLDIGERFGVKVDDYLLRAADKDMKRGSGRIAIPFEPLEADSYGLEPEFRIDNSGAIDPAFYNVATKQGIKELLAKGYPNISALVERIETAGGLREFIKKEYGEAYLGRVTGYLDLDDPKLADLKMEQKSQGEMIYGWDSADSDFKDFFKGSLAEFVNSCVSSAEKNPSFAFSGPSWREAVLRDKAKELMDPKDADSRGRAYKIIAYLARQYQDGENLESAEGYRHLKDQLKQYLLKEQSKPLRKTLVKELLQLSASGKDLTTENDFIEIIKKEAARIRAGKSERGGKLLGPLEMDILRGLFDVRTRDADKAIFELVASPGIDPRLKKICLHRLLGHRSFTSVEKSFVKDDLKKDARNIPWEDYAALYRVENIASATVRERLSVLAASAFDKIRAEGKSISGVHRSMAPQLPPEFFLSLYTLSGGNREQIGFWENLIARAKSQKLRESFLYNISNIRSEMFGSITEKFIKTKEATKEHILLANRLFKKLHLLNTLERYSEASSQELAENFLSASQNPSVLEAKFDEMIVTKLSKLTERGDLTTNKIQSLFQVWEDPESFLIYIAELAQRSPYNKDSKKTLDLVSEMLANIDPPELNEWKGWRYNTADQRVFDQLRGLSPEQVRAYAADEFVDLGEVLVGLLPSDKPERIRSELFHAIFHDWQESGTMSHPVMKLLEHTFAGPRTEINSEAVLSQCLSALESHSRLINSWLKLNEDSRFSSGLVKALDGWQRAEIEKKQKLVSLGYRGNESAQEIDNIVRELQKKREDGKKISSLENLKPNPMPPKTRELLLRYGLEANASAKDLEGVGERVREGINKMASQEDFTALKRSLFGGKEAALEDWQKVIKDLRAWQLVFKFGLLTPQLIAFNKISPEKKKASLREAIGQVRAHFQLSPGIVKTIESVEKIINEVSHPVGKDRLAVIFTDNPLAMISIGRFPAGAESCQHYQNGDRNLASYAADASTKMILLVDIDKLPEDLQSELARAEDSEARLRIFQNNTLAFLNGSVARRITKVVRNTESDRPQLFLEPVYTNLNRESATRILNAFAVTHLHPKIGLDLVRGAKRNGPTDVRVAESRNHEQYEDGESGGPGGGGVGLGTFAGSYSMPAQPITEKDYLL